MILVDANLLIYAQIDSFPHHHQSRVWLDTCLGGHGRVGMPWSSLLAFLRVVTNPRIVAPPVSTAEACACVTEWLANEVVWTPQPTIQHAEILTRLVKGAGAYGNLIPDAHLAALAIEHGLTLYSADADFARFEGLRWINPIVSSP